MRRALAAVALVVSLWLGSLAWTGFVLLRTVLDPGRSRTVAESLYEDERVRDQLADGIAAAVGSALPPGLDVPDASVEAAAEDALASGAVEAVFVDALTRTHAALLGQGEVPDQVDAGALGAAARDAVVDADPALDDVLPAAPELAVRLPTDRLPDLGPARDALAAAVPALALVAAAGTLLALLITSDRPAVLRRAGRWAIGLSAAVLLVAYGVPLLAEAVLPGQAAMLAALVRALSEATRAPAFALAAAGALATVGSFARRWPPARRSAGTIATPDRSVRVPPSSASSRSATMPVPGRRAGPARHARR